MSEMAERIEALVETFARKIAAQAIDIAEQNGRADQLQRELDALRDSHATLTARLGRAVAALREMTPRDTSDSTPDLDAEAFDAAVGNARTILADDESKAAGEAWSEMEAALTKIAASACKDERCTDLRCRDGRLARAALAKVDARRGQGGGR